MQLLVRRQLPRIVENVTFDQMAPMDAGAFGVALDMDVANDGIVDYRQSVKGTLPAQVKVGWL